MPSGGFRPTSALQSAAFVAPNQVIDHVQRIRPIADFAQEDSTGRFVSYHKAGETKWQSAVLGGLTGTGGWGRAPGKGQEGECLLQTTNRGHGLPTGERT